MSKVIISTPSENESLFQADPRPYCSHHFGARSDSWHHCRECRNRTARLQSSITYRYLLRYEDRPILAKAINVAHVDGSHLTQAEVETVITRFKRQFENHHSGGYQIVLDGTAKGRPHWHGLFLGVPDEAVDEALQRAAKGHHAWTSPGEIVTTLSQAVNYMFKIWGEDRQGRPVAIPERGVKVMHMHNFFRVKSKGEIEAEIRALRPAWERQSVAWEPDEEQALERWITRYDP